MTKALTASGKRRRKRHRTISLPGGETVEQRPGRKGAREPARPADEVALFARVRQTGLSLDDARSDMAGCVVGRRLMDERDREELWRAVKHMRRVVIAYDNACRAPRRHAQCLRIMTPPEAMHADASSPAPDDRTQEERDRAAVSAWMALQGWLDHTDRPARSACIRHVVDEPDQPVTDWPGIICALRCVADGIGGRKVVARFRAHAR
jgi:hypothetical protein